MVKSAIMMPCPRPSVVRGDARRAGLRPGFFAADDHPKERSFHQQKPGRFPGWWLKWMRNQHHQCARWEPCFRKICVLDKYRGADRGRRHRTPFPWPTHIRRGRGSVGRHADQCSPVCNHRPAQRRIFLQQPRSPLENIQKLKCVPNRSCGRCIVCYIESQRYYYRPLKLRAY